jgi:hypothetical protein
MIKKDIQRPNFLKEGINNRNAVVNSIVTINEPINFALFPMSGDVVNTTLNL